MKKNISFAVLIVSCSVVLLSTLAAWTDKPVSPSAATIENSVNKSLLLLQKSSYSFINNNPRKCASCHHNTLLSMAAGIAVQKNVPLIDSFTTHRVNAMESTIMYVCNPNHTNEFIPANFIIPYVLLGLNAEKYPGNLYTDVTIDYLISQAKPDGSFLTESGRVPLETGEAHLAAMVIRAIQLYAAPTKKARVNELVVKTKNWFEKLNPDQQQQQEIVFQLLGMQWCGSATDLKLKIAEKLKSLQHSDGGWSQLPSMKSDAYATGQALYALYESGMAKPGDAVYKKGLNYLLKTQTQEGAWVVQTRAYPIQHFINSDFPPYDDNQFISAAATNWATMALLEALPDKTK